MPIHFFTVLVHSFTLSPYSLVCCITLLRKVFMAELSFGEKLLIARKQLDLYQYEMAERLGVHPN